MDAQPQSQQSNDLQLDPAKLAANFSASPAPCSLGPRAPSAHLLRQQDPAGGASFNPALAGIRKPTGLAKGQLWQIENTYIQIVEAGQKLIYYKILKRLGQEAALTRLIGIEAMSVYLRTTEAVLLE